jgi:hypothetical protein
MPDTTPNLLLPYILAAQAQKHITHNEALRQLDGLVQLSVLDRDLTTPPGSPAEGDRYIVASGASGDWVGWDGSVAHWTDGAWLRIPPRTGWRAWVEDEEVLLVFDGSDWIGAMPAVPRFKAYATSDTLAGVGTWTKIAINAADYNGQSAFNTGTNLFTVPVDGTYLFGATLLYKVNSSTTARMRGRLVLNGSTEIRGSFGEISGEHVLEATALWLQTMVLLTAGDTVELQGSFRVADGYFAADHTSFWGAKIG